MSAKVTVDQAVWSETRFRFLAKRLQIDLFSVIGRCIRLWAECTHRGEHWLTEREIDFLAEYDGFTQALIEENLAIILSSPSAGPRLPYGDRTVSSPSAGSAGERIYLKGSRGRIEWLDQFRKQAPKGGLARARSAERDDNGRFKRSPHSIRNSSPSAGRRSPAYSNPSNATSYTVKSKSIPYVGGMSPEQVEAKKNYLKIQAKEMLKDPRYLAPIAPTPPQEGSSEGGKE